MADNYLNQFLIAKSVQINSEKQPVSNKSKNTISIGETDVDISENLKQNMKVPLNFESYLSHNINNIMNPSKQNFQRINIRGKSKIKTQK